VSGKRGNGEGSIYFQESRQRWAAALTLEHGKRRVVYGKTRHEVAKKLTAAMQRRDTGLPIVRERLAVGAWLDHWMEENVRPRYDAESGTQTGGREPTTWASYEILVRRHIKPYIGKIALAKLQVEHVERWQRQLEAAGASAETRRASLVRLRTALNVALQRNHVTRNVAALVSTPRQVRKTYEVPHAEDLRQLLRVIRGDPLEALVYLALGLGLRRSEALGLRWEDVDFENRIVAVRTRVNRLGKGVGLLVRDGLKTQPERRIAIPRLVAEVLRKRWPHQLEARMLAGNQWKGPAYVESARTGFIFTGATGTVLQPRKADLYFAGVRSRAGMESHRFHALRHDFASLLLAAGVADRVVMEMMGHSNIAMTANRYQHVPDELQRLAADRLDDLFASLEGATG
jgi:integrase